MNMNIILHQPGGMSAGRFKSYIPARYTARTPVGYLTCQRLEGKVWTVGTRENQTVCTGTLAECKRFMTNYGECR
jgi:hypothetical protein